MFFEVTQKGSKKKMIVNAEKIDLVREHQLCGEAKSKALIQINGSLHEVEETYEDIIKLVEKCLK